MFQKRLELVTEDDLQRLCDGGAEESIRLEFKRELSLKKDAQKLEFCRDLSAFANAQGGRLVYGIEEDGDGRARALYPMKDRSVLDIAHDVLSSSIAPRMRYDFRVVETSGDGYYLVVEVPQAVSSVHMVERREKHGYFRRGPKGKEPMTEAEVRVAYGRTTRREADLGARVDREFSPLFKYELYRGLVAHCVLPMVARADLVDPARWRSDILRGVTRLGGFRKTFDRLRPDHRGMVHGHHSDFLSVSREGAIRYSDALQENTGRYALHMETLSASIMALLSAGFEVLRHFGYWGGLYYAVRLRVPGVADLRLPNGAKSELQSTGEFEFREFCQSSSEEELWGVVRSIHDRLWQAAGIRRAPCFSQEGVPTEDFAKAVAAELVEY